jgi:hypothetical protein
MAVLPKAPAGNPYDLEVRPSTEVALAGVRPVDHTQEQTWDPGHAETGRSTAAGSLLRVSRPKCTRYWQGAHVCEVLGHVSEYASRQLAIVVGTSKYFTFRDYDTTLVGMYVIRYSASRVPTLAGCVCFRADFGRLQPCASQQGGTDGARHQPQ